MQACIDNNIHRTKEALLELFILINSNPPEHQDKKKLFLLFENFTTIIKYYFDKKNNGNGLAKIDSDLLDNMLDILNNWFLCIDKKRILE
jgi:hypothetical protein